MRRYHDLVPKLLDPLISWAGRLDVARLPPGVAAAAHTQWSSRAIVRRGAPGGNGRPEPTLNLEGTVAFVVHFSALCFYYINYTPLIMCFSFGSVLTEYISPWLLLHVCALLPFPWQLRNAIKSLSISTILHYVRLSLGNLVLHKSLPPVLPLFSTSFTSLYSLFAGF